MYDIGDVVPLGITISDADGTPSDAGAVTLTLTFPDGTVQTPSIDHVPGTGRYTVDYTATVEGLHTVRWVATGANATAYSDVFNVREITDQLISLAEARAQLRFTGTDRDDDLRQFIAAAGTAVEDHTGRTLVRRTITETHPRVRGRILLNRTPAVAVTSLATIDGASTWDVDGLVLLPDIGRVTAASGAVLSGDLTITYLAGMPSIPANYLLATRIIVEHLWQTMRPFSGPANLPPGALGDSLDARAGGLVGFAIPNRALELLGKPPPMVA